MKTNLYLVGLSLLFISLSSCSKDDKSSGPTGSGGPCANYVNWSSSVQAELTAMNNAAIAYGTNPTQANCDAFKAAANAYIDSLENIRSCVGAGQLTAFNANIQAAKASLSGLC